MAFIMDYMLAITVVRTNVYQIHAIIPVEKSFHDSFIVYEIGLIM